MIRQRSHLQISWKELPDLVLSIKRAGEGGLLSPLQEEIDAFMFLVSAVSWLTKHLKDGDEW